LAPTAPSSLQLLWQISILWVSLKFPSSQFSFTSINTIGFCGFSVSK
jgi:hypothetical protein